MSGYTLEQYCTALTYHNLDKKNEELGKGIVRTVRSHGGSKKTLGLYKSIIAEHVDVEERMLRGTPTLCVTSINLPENLKEAFCPSKNAGTGKN